MKCTVLAPLLLPLLGISTLPAQFHTTKVVELPVTNPVPRTDDMPFSQDKIHYQQWYENSQLATKIKQPVRIVGLEFAGALPNGASLDIEVTMAHGSSSLSGVFASNLQSNVVRVIPRRTLNPSGATTRLDFIQDWTYDGKSHVVVDIKIFGNGNGKPIAFNGTSTILTLSNTKRQFFIGNPDAPIANSSGATGHYGLTTRFLYQEGGAYEYGTGCPGGGNVVPVGSADPVPLPGLGNYTQHLTMAGSGYQAVWILGVSRTAQGGGPLPIPLGFLGAPNCNLLASTDFLVFTNTVGGGAGSGKAQLATPIPPIGALGGVTVYSQWIVFDAAAANGSLSATKGLMHVIGN